MPINTTTTTTTLLQGPISSCDTSPPRGDLRDSGAAPQRICRGLSSSLRRVPYCRDLFAYAPGCRPARQNLVRLNHVHTTESQPAKRLMTEPGAQSGASEPGAQSGAQRFCLVDADLNAILLAVQLTHLDPPIAHALSTKAVSFNCAAKCRQVLPS